MTEANQNEIFETCELLRRAARDGMQPIDLTEPFCNLRLST
jgi:hypothetical protein